MSEPVKDGGPAFPNDECAIDGHVQPYKGMSLRDYFAGQVIAGMTLNGAHWTQDRGAEWAAESYAIADAMLKAREATHG